MEWYSKESAWDPLRDQPNVGEAPVENSVSVAETKMSNSKSSSCGGASKRKRVHHKSPERVECLVDGCNFDLGNCREYHRRHRVCQPHSKTSCVLVKGQEQRFCQQCSRFQSLDEFDGFKRSCRRRLEGHNKRRRKARPPPLAFSADYKGPRILQFGNPSSDDRYVSMWSAQPAARSYNRYPPILPKTENMQEKHVYWYNNQAVPPLAETGIGDRNQKMPWDSALYLLSALQAPSSSEFSMVESSIDCPIQSQPAFEDDDGTPNRWCSSSRSVTNGPGLGVDPNEANFHQNGMLQMEPGGGSLTFPFSGSN